MPKYFFHISDGRKELEDVHGVDLEDRSTALQIAKRVAADLGRSFECGKYWIVVRDQYGDEVVTEPVVRRH